MADGPPPTQLRWSLADDPAGQGELFDRVVERRPGTGQFRGMEFLHVHARSLVNRVPGASRMPFEWTVNVYRGCSHACTYCFARPTHAYLGLDTGEDFERRIVVKVNAVERLRAELDPRRWPGHHIAMGTNTDPYQRCEGLYRLTRGVVEELTRVGNPFSLLTKGTLVLRDLDVLAEAARRGLVRVNLSIGTLDEAVWRETEPGTPHPARRVEAVARLNEAGVPCGVLVAPVLPGLSDRTDQLAAVVDACVAAGARSISTLLLHLRPGVREPYLAWLGGAHPDLVERYQALYPRSYAPKADQRRLAERFGRLVERAGGRAASPLRSRETAPAAPAAPAARSTPPAGPPPSQLALGL
ncbi:MAG TPA: radical SAM protein [Acidimicrobiales bacterium]